MGNYEENKHGYQIGAEKPMECFHFNDGADSTLVSLAKKPAFRLEKAVL